MNKNHYSIKIIGSGNSHSKELGNSSICLYKNLKPILFVDMGSETFFEYNDEFLNKETIPPIFITHNHMDHIGGMERLFYRHIFDCEKKGPIKLFIPTQLIPKLHRMVASHGTALAEGGVNFWDAFQVIPVEDFFYHCGMRFDVFPVRHQFWGEAFGFSLQGKFFYSGDTRPIPEQIVKYASSDEIILHDSGLKGNPAHAGIDDIEREYAYLDISHRIILYHMDSVSSIEKAKESGWDVAEPGRVLNL